MTLEIHIVMREREGERDRERERERLTKKSECMLRPSRWRNWEYRQRVNASLESKLYRICTQSHRLAKSRRENKNNKGDRDGRRIWEHDAAWWKADGRCIPVLVCAAVEDERTCRQLVYRGWGETP
jgi:hypothetical protein